MHQRHAEWQLVCLTHNLLKLYRSRQADADSRSRTNRRNRSWENRDCRNRARCLHALRIVGNSLRRFFILAAVPVRSETLLPTDS